jgi:hypothetical protein
MYIFELETGRRTDVGSLAVSPSTPVTTRHWLRQKMTVEKMTKIAEDNKKLLLLDRRAPM